MKKCLRYNKVHKDNFIFYGVMIFVLAALIYSGLYPYLERSFNNEQCIMLNEQWTYIDELGIAYNLDLPTHLKPNIEKGIRISKELPTQSESKVGTIGMFATMQYVTAYLDGEKIYSYQPENREIPNYGKIDGASWHVMRLPDEWHGKELVLEITSPYPEYRGMLKNVFLGTKASFLFKVIQIYGGGLLLAFGIIFSGLILLVIYGFIHKRLASDRGISYLGWFQLWIGLWVFAESGLTQFFFSNEKIIQTLSFISLMMIPIPLLLYAHNRKNVQFKKVLKFQVWVHVVEIVVVTLLQFADIRDYYETLIYTHIILIITIALIAGISAYERIINKNKEFDFILFCSLVLGGCGILELIIFYEVNRFQLGKFFNVGLTICIIVSVLKAVRQMRSVLRLSSEAQYYEKLATMDYMTGCQNRTSYLKELQKQNEILEKYNEIAVVVSDLNCLKHINDELGHTMGDNVIRLCATMLEDSFGTIGTCYRIGGDEFVCLIYNHKEDVIKEMMSQVTTLCENESIEWGHEFEIAIGYSFYNQELDRDLEATIQRADEKMYETKRSMKMYETQD